MNPTNWQQQAKQFLIEGDYQQAANLYEQAIAIEPEVTSHYWHLGLLRLLQGEEAEAQMTWLLVMSEGEPEQIEVWTEELCHILQTEAQRREAIADYHLAWVLRQHIREIAPNTIINLLHSIQLSLQLGYIAEGEELGGTDIAEAVQHLQSTTIPIDPNLLLQVLQQLLECCPRHPQVIAFTEACVSYCQRSNQATQPLIHLLFNKTDLFINQLPAEITLKYAKLCQQLQPNTIGIVANLANLYQNSGQYLESLTYARQLMSMSPALEEQIAGHYLMVRGLMRAGGYWQEAYQHYQTLQDYIRQLITTNRPIKENHLISIMGTVTFSNYFTDDPKHSHEYRNQVAQFCQAGLRNHYNQNGSVYKSPFPSHSRLKIGYLSSCLRTHSVGWLARWLFNYHDTNAFEIYVYSLKHADDFVQRSIAQSADQFYTLPPTKTIKEIATQIAEDEIDILVDLDSVTGGIACGIMALKPAPIQITWLGSDASGIPAIDYFIADAYVLPDSAQEYYSAKIWRLPTTYIAVDGFEVGVPTLRREDLTIEPDAIIYLSSQTAYKRHPNTARLQLEIIKHVPNSHLLIKGLGDEDSIQRLFTQLATEVGIESTRLHFLPSSPSEAIHRAELGIADVVLDTYPYNGATTTLETLWVGVPLVTRVGEQFAARNSYTMMLNAGITQGIASSDEDYIEWGVRLGTHPNLRQQISWQLRQSRQTSPLWNAKQFTRDMEDAYRQMHVHYLESR